MRDVTYKMRDDKWEMRNERWEMRNEICEMRDFIIFISLQPYVVDLAPLGCKDIGIMIFEFVAKIQFFSQKSMLLQILSVEIW